MTFSLFGKSKGLLKRKESQDITPLEVEEEFGKKNIDVNYQFFVKYSQEEMT